MYRMTRKRRRFLRKVAGPREAFRQAHHYTCMACGCSGAGDVHEIARGPHRHAAMSEPACWLLLCRSCHEDMGAPDYPIARQLALKQIRDAGNYDRRRVNVLRGRQPEAITEEEVNQWVEDFLDEDT